MSLISICQMLGFGSRAENSNLSVDSNLVGSIIGFKLCFFGLDVATSGCFSCLVTLYFQSGPNKSSCKLRKHCHLLGTSCTIKSNESALHTLCQAMSSRGLSSSPSRILPATLTLAAPAVPGWVLISMEVTFSNCREVPLLLFDLY